MPNYEYGCKDGQGRPRLQGPARDLQPHPAQVAPQVECPACIHVALEQWLLQAQQERRERAQAPWGPLWAEGHRQALRVIEVSFYVVKPSVYDAHARKALQEDCVGQVTGR